MIDSDIYYFGCHTEPGHFVFRPGMSRDSQAYDDITCEVGAIDGKFAPPMDQYECVARCVQKHGWTILAWWDRSVDNRPNSNSALLARGSHTSAKMMEALQRHFPSVFSRQRNTVLCLPPL